MGDNARHREDLQHGRHLQPQKRAELQVGKLTINTDKAIIGVTSEPRFATQPGIVLFNCSLICELGSEDLRDEYI